MSIAGFFILVFLALSNGMNKDTTSSNGWDTVMFGVLGTSVYIVPRYISFVGLFMRMDVFVSYGVWRSGFFDVASSWVC